MVIHIICATNIIYAKYYRWRHGDEIQLKRFENDIHNTKVREIAFTFEKHAPV